MPIELPVEELRAWSTLLRAPRLGPVALSALLGVAGSPLDACRGGASLWRACALPQAAQDWLRRPDHAQLDRDLDWLQGVDHHLLLRADPRYPERLGRLGAGAPLALFVDGDPTWLGLPLLAVVGSRNASASGLECARDFAATLARSGLTVLSGLAEGIDGAAHAAALDAGGGTVAICGTGLDQVYPLRHAGLARRIADSGALVSEFVPGTAPRPGHFPRRNRLIAALALGTLVIEAGLASGSLITARLTAEIGGEVFAIPGSIMSPHKRGCHRLIREGAKLVESASDVLEELKAPLRQAGLRVAQIAIHATGSVAQAGGEEADSDQALVLRQLGYEPASVDQLVQRCRIDAARVAAALLLLEVAGRVASDAGGRHVRCA